MTADMQSGIDYCGSLSDQIQQFMVGRQSVDTASHIFSTSNNSNDFLGSQIKQQSGRLQPVQRLVLQSPDSPENHNYLPNSLKQKAQTVYERCPDEDIGAVGERGGKNSEANRWPREETLALLRIRAAICTNSRDSNVKGPVWETVSRKLAEMGFHRSAKKCKEKFENVNKYYKKTRDGRINRQDGKSYRFCSEIEALYVKASVKNGGTDKGANIGACTDANIGNQDNVKNYSSALINNINQLQEETAIPRSTETIDNTSQNLSSDGTSTEEVLGKSKSDLKINRKRRKRKRSLSSIKDLLENMIKRLMECQENSQKKFLEAIEKRDKDGLIREEAWKRQEMARLNRETELRAQEHALQSSREKAIIEFLEKLASKNFKLNPRIIPIQSAANVHQDDENNTAGEKLELHSKRWPNPEVYALIKLRSEMDLRYKESIRKVALWEDISSAMACMGFHRSAKRCKEKWENINKYFRKTKRSMEKRPLNSKTCPYFLQLDTLYAKGVFLSPNHPKSDNKQENPSNSEALIGIDGDNVDQEGGQELKANDQDPELLAIVAASAHRSVQPASTSSETTDYLAQRMMKWNQNVIQTMDYQAVSLDSRPSAEYLCTSNNDNDNNKRFKMERLVQKGLGTQQNQYQKFLEGCIRREHEEQHHADKELGHHQQQQNQQGEKYQANLFPKPEEHQQSQSIVSQAGLMDLVHKLSTNFLHKLPAQNDPNPVQQLQVVNDPNQS